MAQTRKLSLREAARAIKKIRDRHYGIWLASLNQQKRIQLASERKEKAEIRQVQKRCIHTKGRLDRMPLVGASVCKVCGKTKRSRGRKPSSLP